MIPLLPRHALAALALTLAALAGCGSDPTGAGGNGGGTTTTAPSTHEVSAAKGGTVADPESTVLLNIPAGALVADAEITLTVTPKQADTVTAVYAFGPAGTQFESPATLSIDTDGVTVPTGKKVVLAVQQGASWSEVPGSVVSGSAVQAPVTVLATYSAILADDAPSGACDATCMAQAGAVCCTDCGCQGAVKCQPQCAAATPWDCEIGCCFDYDALMCAP